MFSALGDVPKRLTRLDQEVPLEPQLSVPLTHAQEGSPLQGPGVYCTSMSETTVHGEACWRPHPDLVRFSE